MISAKTRTSTAQSDADVLASCDVSEDDIDKLNSAFAPRLWLEVLPSRAGIVLAALLAEIMTEGLTPEQMDLLGDFVSAVGTLISYKASRDGKAMIPFSYKAKMTAWFPSPERLPTVDISLAVC